ncbi:PREDICTED: anthocyanidin 3-O-glucosyltransferase 7-like [Tarenaya hassleriana]|uniref:anthocyanidin 3-O-glucosyltransferase 7-like n=1 Tax=Tarenaya hassleriana TaxID=28532 RepID=UPI00053C2A13|nr:PREDICTED: anthocyanidin 3-O-glucosyltransferase 7-like [Tarenaya hassleriana]
MDAAPQPRKHIAVLAFPFTTHAAPLLSLVRRISAVSVAGEIRFHFFSTRRSNAALFSGDGGGGDVEAHDVWDGVPEGHVFSGDPDEAVGMFLRSAVESFRAAIAAVGVEFRCLLTDAFLWFAAELAEEMHVPWVPFWTAGPRAMLVHVDVVNIRNQMGFNGPGDKTLDFLPDFSSVRTVDLPSGIISGDTEATIPSLLNKLGAYLPRAAAVATNSFEELDPVVVETLKSKLTRFLNIGPLALTSPPPHVSDDEHRCLEFLSGKNPATVAYISFGSLIVPPPPEISALAGALEERKIPFLWSFRGNPDEIFPESFLERTKGLGKFVPWAPQLRVLQNSSVGVFITHGGWNSVTESVIGGIPMICRPFFGDQTLNVRTVEAVWGIGIGVEGNVFTKGSTLKALEAVLVSKKGGVMRENLRKRRELAFAAVKPGGTSSENFKTLVDIITQ